MRSGRLRALEPVAYAVAALGLALIATAAAYETQVYVPLAAAAAAAGAALAFARPIAALHLALAVIPLELVSVRFGGAFALSPSEAMFALTGMAWGIQCLMTRRPLAPYSPLSKPFALTLLAIFAGLLVAEESSAVLKAGVMWTAFTLVYCMLVSRATARTVRSLLAVLVLSAAVVAVIALVRSGGQAPQLIGSGAVAIGRATGSFNQPNILATFLAFALPAALVLAFISRPALRPWMAAAFGLIFAGLALSLCRGGFLAFAGALAVLLGLRSVRRVTAVVALVVVGLTLAGGNPLIGSADVQLVSKRIASVRYTSAGTGDDRRQVWERTPGIVADNPLFGVGAFNFSKVAPRYGIVAGNGDVYLHAHDIVLTIAAERGLLGLIALLWGGGSLALMLLRTIARTTGGDHAVAFALAAGFCGMTLQGLVDYTFVSNALVAVFFTLAGCAAVMWRAAPVSLPTISAGDASWRRERSRSPRG